LTLNTWQERGPWRDRWELIFAGIERLRPDLVAFQELFNLEWAWEVRKRTGFEHLLLPELFCGLAFLTHLPVVRWEYFRLNPSPLEDYSRGALWAVIEAHSEKILALNTHLSWKPEDGASRKKQLTELLAFVREEFPKDAVVACGDFNATPGSEEIQWFLAQGKFCDLYAVSHPGENGFTWDNRNPYAAECGHKLPDRRLDYILARHPNHALANLTACDLVYQEPDPRSIWASDHFGLLADFR
jgi:endonuclease/exonuclease/phosphatase family metal-dependent hydrolase